MSFLKIKDGFLGEKQINVPREVIIKQLRNQPFLNSLFITHIGYFPKAKFHYRERQHGSVDNILIYCVSGKGHYQTAQDNYILQANQFMILPPGEFHIYQADIHNPWSIYWVHFSGTKIKELNKWLQTEKFIQPTPIEYNKHIFEQWVEMYTALQSGYTQQNLAFANLCLYRFLTFFTCPLDTISRLDEEDHIGDSIAFMKANIGKLLTVEELAAQLQYSSSHYTALFKNNTGSAPIDYFIKLKIHYACQLLSQTNMKINEIADKVGYDDSFYFSRIFKKITGKSPKDYRQSLQTRI